MDQDLLIKILLVLMAVAIIGLVAVFLYCLKLNRSERELKELLKNESLSRSSISSDLLNLSDSTVNKLIQFEERVSSNLIQANRSSTQMYRDISERMIRIDEAQKSLDELSKEMLALKSVLTDKKSRGVFGEIELYSLLEQVIPSELFIKQCRLSNNSIVDAAVRVGGDSLLCIDSKFPLENFQRLNDEDPKTRVAFRNDVIKHIRDIATKYLSASETADVALMFIPSESVFAEIYSSYPEIVSLSYENRVFIVSPTTTMAYLTALRSIYIGQKKEEKAREISIYLRELAREFGRLKERSEQLEKDYQKILPDFDKLNTTIGRLIRHFDLINTGEFDNGEDKTVL